ncbi:MAG: iron-sulfur protein, partial [Acidimicrobiia bacterium]
MSPRIKPTIVVYVIGGIVTLITITSGILGEVLGYHDESETTREVFGNVPSAMVLLFYSITPILVIAGTIAFAQRVRNWERGQPDRRATTRKNIGNRLADFRAGVYMQTLLRDPASGLMHSLIYFSFLILLAVTTVLEINHQVPEGAKFLHGDVYKGYVLVGDLAGVTFLLGVLWALYRRYVQRVYRIRIKSKPEHALILGTFFVLGVSGFGAEAFRIALQDRPDFEKFAFVGYPLSGLVDGFANLEIWHRGWWIAHVLAFMAFLAILPITMLRHIFT